MEFIDLTPSLAHEWDNVVQTSDEAWLYHLYAWLALSERVWNLQSKSFLVKDHGRIVGIVPLQLNKRTKVLKSTAMGPAGIALVNGLSFEDRTQILSSVHRQIEAIALEAASPEVEIYISPLTEACLNSPDSTNPLTTFGYSDTSTQSYVVDLRSSNEELFGNFSKNVREELKKAERIGYTISQAFDMEDYYKVHCENYARTNATAHPKAYFDEIYSNICAQGQAVLWKACDPKGKAVAFELIGLYKKKAIYWTGCCLSDHLEHGANYLLQVHAMQWAKAQGAQWFENGEAFPAATDKKLKGLTVFKAKFGGKLRPFYKGKRSLRPQSFHYKARQSVKQLLGPQYSEIIGQNLRKIQALGRIIFLKPYWGAQEMMAGFIPSSPDTIKDLKLAFVRTFDLNGDVVPTSSGRTALDLALRALKQKNPNRTKVILPAYSCKGIYDPIISNGLIPVYADIDDNLNISAESVKEITQKEEGLLAVIVPHLGGCPADIKSIMAVAKLHDIVVIEDLCHALGGILPSADIAFFSFGIGKNVTATAGGMLYTKIIKFEINQIAKTLGDQETGSVIKRHRAALKQYFVDPFKAHEWDMESAYQFNAMHPLDAQLALIQLSKIGQINSRQTTHAQEIIKSVADSSYRCRIPADVRHVYTKCSLIFDDPSECAHLRAKFETQGVEVEDMYVPLHVRGLEGKTPVALSLTEQVYKNVFNVPVRANLTFLEINRIKAIIAHAYAQRN